jgi:uncharacterized membrane protein YeiH
MQLLCVIAGLTLVPHPTVLEIPLWLNLSATAVGALEGALIASRAHKYDLTGVFVIALCLGFGGGLIRDVLLGSLPPTALQSPWYLLTVVVAVVVALPFARRVRGMPRLLVLLDALTLGLFAVVGTDKALQFNVPLVAALFIGTAASVGGGVAADMLMQRTPMVLKPAPLYALAGLAGAVTFWVLRDPVGTRTVFAVAGALAVTTTLRILAERYGLRAPMPTTLESEPPTRP